MDFCFRCDETSSAAARRVAREQLERAIVELGAESDVDRAVHSVRKRLKKLRGLLRLVEGGLGRDAFELENRVYRDAGRRLEGPRRAAAVLAAYDALLERSPGAVPDAAAAALRERLSASRDQRVDALHRESHAQDVAASLRESLARIDDWPLPREGWPLYEAGFRKSYARGRRAFLAALDEPTTERFHEWRKQAKHHLYHVRLLERIWPEALRAVGAELDALTEALGAEHDLDDLRQTLIERAPPPDLADATARVLELLAARRAELRASAIARGKRVWAERPRAIAARFGAYHAAWLEAGDADPRCARQDD